MFCVVFEMDATTTRYTTKHVIVKILSNKINNVHTAIVKEKMDKRFKHLGFNTIYAPPPHLEDTKNHNLINILL